MKEFNLSEKIEKVFSDAKDCWYHKAIKEDVKEFIRRLKKELDNEWSWNIRSCFDKIDKLAGEELK